MWIAYLCKMFDRAGNLYKLVALLCSQGNSKERLLHFSVQIYIHKWTSLPQISSEQIQIWMLKSFCSYLSAGICNPVQLSAIKTPLWHSAASKSREQWNSRPISAYFPLGTWCCFLRFLLTSNLTDSEVSGQQSLTTLVSSKHLTFICISALCSCSLQVL